MRQRTIKIAAGEAYELTAPGDYLRIRSASVALTIETDKREIIEASQGDDFELSNFTRLRISHDSASEQVVKLLISDGKRAGSSQVSGNITLGGSSYSQDVATVTTASAELLPQNNDRRTLIIQNNSASGSVYVRLDGAAATAANGLKIAPGGSLVLDSNAPTGQVNAIGDIASNPSVIVIEG